MNRLPMAKRVQIVNALVEGVSLRATSRMADVSINTVSTPGPPIRSAAS